MSLYRISEESVKNIIKNRFKASGLESGRHEILEEVDSHGYPLKVVFSVQKDQAIVITVYPLKKGLKK